MARGAQQAAFGNEGTAQNTGHMLLNEGQNELHGTLFPALQQQINNPQGMGKDLNSVLGTINSGANKENSIINQGAQAANTASQQSLGGSVAGAVGQGNLEGARTRNAGAFAPALDESARQGGRQLSQNALGVQEDKANAQLGVAKGQTAGQTGAQMANAEMRNAQREAAMQGLDQLYGQNLHGTLSSMGLADQANQNALQAGQTGFQDWMAPFQLAMQGAGTGADIYKLTQPSGK